MWWPLFLLTFSTIFTLNNLCVLLIIYKIVRKKCKKCENAGASKSSARKRCVCGATNRRKKVATLFALFFQLSFNTVATLNFLIIFHKPTNILPYTLSRILKNIGAPLMVTLLMLLRKTSKLSHPLAYLPETLIKQQDYHAESCRGVCNRRTSSDGNYCINYGSFANSLRKKKKNNFVESENSQLEEALQLVEGGEAVSCEELEVVTEVGGSCGECLVKDVNSIQSDRPVTFGTSGQDVLNSNKCDIEMFTTEASSCGCDRSNQLVTPAETKHFMLVSRVLAVIAYYVVVLVLSCLDGLAKKPTHRHWHFGVHAIFIAWLVSFSFSFLLDAVMLKTYFKNVQRFSSKDVCSLKTLSNWHEEDDCSSQRTQKTSDDGASMKEEEEEKEKVKISFCNSIKKIDVEKTAKDCNNTLKKNFEKNKGALKKLKSEDLLNRSCETQEEYECFTMSGVSSSTRKTGNDKVSTLQQKYASSPIRYFYRPENCFVDCRDQHNWLHVRHPSQNVFKNKQVTSTSCFKNMFQSSWDDVLSSSFSSSFSHLNENGESWIRMNDLDLRRSKSKNWQTEKRKKYFFKGQNCPIRYEKSSINYSVKKDSTSFLDKNILKIKRGLKGDDDCTEMLIKPLFSHTTEPVGNETEQLEVAVAEIDRRVFLKNCESKNKSFTASQLCEKKDLISFFRLSRLSKKGFFKHRVPGINFEKLNQKKKKQNERNFGHKKKEFSSVDEELAANSVTFDLEETMNSAQDASKQKDFNETADRRTGNNAEERCFTAMQPLPNPSLSNNTDSLNVFEQYIASDHNKQHAFNSTSTSHFAISISCLISSLLHIYQAFGDLGVFSKLLYADPWLWFSIFFSIK